MLFLLSCNTSIIYQEFLVCVKIILINLHKRHRHSWLEWFFEFQFQFLCLIYRLPFPGLPHIYFLFTVRLKFSGNECWDIYKFDTNERVGVFLARRSVQHLVVLSLNRYFAETSLTKVWTDGRTRWLQYSPLSTSGGII
jgi:hypothetical protein